MTEEEYSHFVKYQRALAREHLGFKLDQLCHEWSMDPYEVWRRPRLLGTVKEAYKAVVEYGRALSQAMKPLVELSKLVAEEWNGAFDDQDTDPIR